MTGVLLAALALANLVTVLRLERLERIVRRHFPES